MMATEINEIDAASAERWIVRNYISGICLLDKQNDIS